MMEKSFQANGTKKQATGFAFSCVLLVALTFRTNWKELHLKFGLQQPFHPAFSAPSEAAHFHHRLSHREKCNEQRESRKELALPQLPFRDDPASCCFLKQISHDSLPIPNFWEPHNYFLS